MPEPGDWFPTEHRKTPKIDESMGLLVHQMRAMAVRLDEQNAKLDGQCAASADLLEIKADLKAMVANRRALSVGRQAVAWIGGAIIGVAATWEGGRHLWDLIRGLGR